MNVLGISITFIPSVLLCGHCQLDYLAKNNKINYKFVPEHFLNNKDIEWADILVFIRSDSDMEAYVAKKAKSLGKKLIYVLDDDLLNVPSYASSYPYYCLPSTHKNMKTVMKCCDTFLTPSPVLMEKYGGPFKYKYLIKEPSLNRIDSKPVNDKVKIGFAGSIDRAKDINDILKDTIERLVDKYGDQIEIEFMGAKPEFVDRLKLKYLPYQDGYEAYTAFMAKCNWDIGLAPMPDSEFHRCKYFNKFVEYASFGIVGVYSNLEPYVYGIENNINGLLVENTSDAWFNAICELIENKEKRKKISKECLRQAKDIYSLEVNAEDYLEKITNNYVPVEHKKLNSFAMAKAVFLVKRIYRKVREQGSNFPSWLVNKLATKNKEKQINKELSNNTKELVNKVKNYKTIYIIGEYTNDLNDDYSYRVAFIDKLIKDKRYVVYLNGENRMLEQVNTIFIDDEHAQVSFNSYDGIQYAEVKKMIEDSGMLLIHGVNSFLSERLSVNMHELLKDEKIVTIWDAHGMIPEKYHKNLNYHAEKTTNNIEKEFYDLTDYLLVDSKELVDHFKNKYTGINKEILVIDDDNKSQLCDLL